MRAGRGWAEFEKRGFFGTPFLLNAAQSYHLTNFNEYCTKRIKLVSFVHLEAQFRTFYHRELQDEKSTYCINNVILFISQKLGMGPLWRTDLSIGVRGASYYTRMSIFNIIIIDIVLGDEAEKRLKGRGCFAPYFFRTLPTLIHFNDISGFRTFKRCICE